MYIASKSLYTVSSMFNCEYCGQEIENDKAKDWEERHKRLEKVEFQNTIRRSYYSVTEDSDEVCLKCYWKLMIKKILIRLLSWSIAFFFIIGFFFSQGNPFMTVLTMASLIVGFTTFIFNRSSLYSAVGFVLSPILGPCEMHPFGDEHTIRERREDKVPISVERKLKRVKHYLMREYRISEIDADIVLISSDLQYEMEENYEKYKRMKTKELARIVASSSEHLQNK